MSSQGWAGGRDESLRASLHSPYRPHSFSPNPRGQGGGRGRDGRGKGKVPSPPPQPPLATLGSTLHTWVEQSCLPGAPLLTTVRKKRTVRIPLPCRMSHLYHAALVGCDKGEEKLRIQVWAVGLVKDAELGPFQTCRISGKARESKFLNQSLRVF